MGLREMGSGAKFGQTFLVFVNIWFAILGIGLIILGAVVRLGKVADGRIINLFRGATLAGMNLGDVIVAVSAIIIVVGVFTLFLSADGGIGACLKKKTMLVVYVVVLAVILILQIALLIVWCKVVYGTNTWLREQFTNLFRFYNAPDVGGSRDMYTEGWDTLFIVLDCCGVSPTSAMSNDFQTLGTYFLTNPARGRNMIPFSCCKQSNLGNYRFGVNPQCTMLMQQPLIRPRGCYEAFRQAATDVSTGAIITTVLFIITEIVAILSAILLIRHIDRDKTGSLDTSNPKRYRGHEIAMPDSKPR